MKSGAGGFVFLAPNIKRVRQAFTNDYTWRFQKKVGAGGFYFRFVLTITTRKS